MCAFISSQFGSAGCIAQPFKLDLRVAWHPSCLASEYLHYELDLLIRNSRLSRSPFVALSAA